MRVSEPSVPVISNVTAKAATDPAELRTLMVEQVTAPVLWSDSLARCQRHGVRHFLEVGPGNVLGGLVRQHAKDASCRQLGTVEDLHEFLG